MAKTKTDESVFDTIKQAVKLVFEEMGVATKDDLKYLPNKEEYYAKQDEMMKELKAIRDEQAMLSQHSSDHSDRIEVLEKIHPHGVHIAAD